MDLHHSPQAVAAAQRIQARTGIDVLDEPAVAQLLDRWRAQRARALRWAVLSGVLAVSVAGAWIAAAALGQVQAIQAILGAVLLVLNLARLLQALAVARKLKKQSQAIVAAQQEVRLAAAGSGMGPFSLN